MVSPSSGILIWLGFEIWRHTNSVFLRDWVKKWGLGPKATGAKYWRKKNDKHDFPIDLGTDNWLCKKIHEIS